MLLHLQLCLCKMDAVPLEALPNLADDLQAKGEADRYLIESGLTYTIVRPGYLRFDPSTVKVEIAAHFASITKRDILRGDVAQVIVSCRLNSSAAINPSKTHSRLFEAWTPAGSVGCPG